MHVYAWNYPTVIGIMLIGLIIWNLLPHYIPEKIWKLLNLAGTCIAALLILKFTVWGRIPQPQHRFAFAAPVSSEFYLEMIMNVFLYFPLGLTLSVLTGPWSVLMGFVLSLSIESWQYIAGTGLAQGTDVICNTLGVAVGMIRLIKIWSTGGIHKWK